MARRGRKGVLIVIDDVVKLIEGDQLIYKGESLEPVFEKLGIEAERLMKRRR